LLLPKSASRSTGSGSSKSKVELLSSKKVVKPTEKAEKEEEEDKDDDENNDKDEGELKSDEEKDDKEEKEEKAEVSFQMRHRVCMKLIRQQDDQDNAEDPKAPLSAIEEEDEDSDEVVAQEEIKTKVKPVSYPAGLIGCQLKAKLVVQIKENQKRPKGGNR
jgi:hypothetical protein